MMRYTKVEGINKSHAKAQSTWNFALVHHCWYVTESHLVSDVLLLVYCCQTWFRAAVAHQFWGIVRNGDIGDGHLWPCCHTACGVSERVKIELNSFIALVNLGRRTDIN